MSFLLFCHLVTLLSSVHGRGLMLLYRPLDISAPCVYSQHLRYDLSFGMGMSDTITLVLRTLSEMDYTCEIEIVTERDIMMPEVRLIVVIRFPNNIGYNCMLNPKGFIILKKDMCYLLCDQIESRDVYATYYATSSLTRFRFRFQSNSSVNTDMQANLYEVTATSARQKGPKGCNMVNETICIIDSQEFCFTSGVVCDGIKNCGASDWFDERQADCELPVQTLGTTPVVAVAAVIICALLAAIHVLLQHLPPVAHSFFIFNANEDNRFRLDPIFHTPTLSKSTLHGSKRKSVIPVFTSSSSDETSRRQELADNMSLSSINQTELEKQRRRKQTMTERLHRKFRVVTDRVLPLRRASGPGQTQNI